MLDCFWTCAGLCLSWDGDCYNINCRQYERSPAAWGKNDLCGVDAPDDGVCNVSLDAHNPFKIILTVVK